MDLVPILILLAILGVVAAGVVVVGRSTRDVDALHDPSSPAPDGAAAVLVDDEPAPPSAPTAAAPAQLPAAERFRLRLSRSANALGASVAGVFGRGIDEDTWDQLEEALITADVGVTATTELIEELRAEARSRGLTDGAELLPLLKEQLRLALGDHDRSLARADDEGPTVWLVTGVNGAGKTTTIGKLAAVERQEGRACVLAAADTFRAAAAEQLELWGERTGQLVVRRDEGTDPASVAYDGYQAARATDAPLLIVDTAGRLHNKSSLMDELAKVKRVVEQQAGPLEEVLLVLDGTTGQNGIAQARAFTDVVEVSGIVLTKLDGSSRGGIVVAVQRELGLPVKLVGLGEDIDDLAAFDADAFVEGLFADVGAG